MYFIVLKIHIFHHCKELLTILKQLLLFSLLSYISSVLTWIFPTLQNSFTSFNMLKPIAQYFLLMIKKMLTAFPPFYQTFCSSDWSMVMNRDIECIFEDDKCFLITTFSAKNVYY